MDKPNLRHLTIINGITVDTHAPQEGIPYPLSYYYNLKQNTEEWHKRRQDFTLTASEMGAALGLSKHTTFRKLLTKKRILLHSLTEQASSPPNQYLERILEWGRNHESVGTSMFERITGLKTEETGIYPIMAPTALGERFVFAASPDRRICHPETGKLFAVLEVKCPWTKKIYGELNSGLLPTDHYIQLQAQMVGAQVDFAYYTCWTPDCTVIAEVTRDYDLWQTSILPRLLLFKELIDNKEEILPKRGKSQPKFPLLLSKLNSSIRQSVKIRWRVNIGAGVDPLSQTMKWPITTTPALLPSVEKIQWNHKALQNLESQTSASS
jgi:hypothetical protein